MNKFIYLIILLFISIESFSFAAKQDSTFFIGAWGGFSYSKIIGYSQETEMLVKPNYGISFTYYFHQEFYLKSGIGFLQNGFTTVHLYTDTTNDTIGNFKTFNEFSYFSIPFEINYNFGRKKFNPYLNFGVAVDFLSKQQTYADLPSEYNGTEVIPFKQYQTDLYKTVNFNLVFGIGIEYRLKPYIVFFSDFKYHYGLSQILKKSNTYIFKHRSLFTNIGIRFAIF